MRLIVCLSVVLFFALPHFTWGAGNQSNRTLTVNNGMGVNNGTNRNTSTNDNSETACAGGNQGSCGSFGGATGPFADTSNPFSPNSDCSPNGFGDVCSSAFDPGLPGGFNVPDNRFGRGAPCGPNDVTGPPFPYPCHTKGSINEKIPLGMDDPNTPGIITSQPTLGAVGQPYYQFRSDSFGTLRANHIEYGFDLNVAGQQTFKIFFTIDSTTDANGQMVGNATGSYKMRMSENFGGGSTCTVTAANPSSEGQFESGMTGVITCVDRAGNACQGSQFNPTKFSFSGGERCAP
jgi:hypothetical protein